MRALFVGLLFASASSMLLAQTVGAPLDSAGTRVIDRAHADDWSSDLESGWKTHDGDDAGWAKPEFDDSGWQTVRIDDQGHHGLVATPGHALRLALVPAAHSAA